MKAATAQPTPEGPLRSRARVLGAAALIGALGVASCCMIPLLLALAGVGGAWVSSLDSLAPLRSYFLWGASGALLAGFYVVYSRKSDDCGACARPRVRMERVILWCAAFILASALTAERFERWL
jgi:mercuric ion transport protein